MSQSDEKTIFINIHGHKKIKDIIGILHNYVQIDSVENHIALDCFCLLHRNKTPMQIMDELEEYINFD